MASAYSVKNRGGVQKVSSRGCPGFRFRPHFQGFKKIFDFFSCVHEGASRDARLAPVAPLKDGTCNARITGSHLWAALAEMPPDLRNASIDQSSPFFQRHGRQAAVGDVRCRTWEMIGSDPHVILNAEYQPVASVPNRVMCIYGIVERTANEWFRSFVPFRHG